MHKNFIPIITAAFLLFCVIGAFWRLFYPISSLIVTPDFIRSDALHSSIALKLSVNSAIHGRYFPFWNDSIQQGFPVLGEGQAGIFYPPNVIFQFLFPGVVAYNFILIFTIFTCAYGMYAFLRSYKFSRYASVFGGLVFSFSGPIQSHLTHIALLQGISLLPWLFWAIKTFIQKPSGKKFAIISCLFAGAFLTGSPQPAIISGIFLIPYGAYLSFAQKQSFKIPIYAIFALFSGILLAAVQILPSREFLTQTAQPSGFTPDTSAVYQYPLKHLLTLLLPNALGNPAEGTYFAQDNPNLSIYWENTGYFGIIPFTLCLIGLLLLATGKIRILHGKFFFYMLIASLLLMFGMKSPLYIIFSLWPFTLFHVTSRFIVVFVFACIYFAVSIMNNVLSSRNFFMQIVIYSTLVILTALDFFHLWRPYHAIAPSKDWVSAPTIAHFVPETGTQFTLGTAVLYNMYFQKGWKSLQPFRFMNNALLPNITSQYGIRTFTSVSGRPLRRTANAISLLSDEIKLSTKEAEISPFGEKLLSIYDITSILTLNTFPQYSQNEIAAVQNSDGAKLTLYKTNTSSHMPYIANTIFGATTLEEAKAILASDTFLSTSSALINSPIQISNKNITGSVTIIPTGYPDTQKFHTQSSDPSFLMLPLTYYPGWIALVNGKRVQLLQANIYQTAVPVPAGNAEINLKYRPSSLAWGIGISVVTGIVLSVIAVFPISSSAYYTGKNTKRRQ